MAAPHPTASRIAVLLPTRSSLRPAHFPFGPHYRGTSVTVPAAGSSSILKRSRKSRPRSPSAKSSSYLVKPRPSNASSAVRSNVMLDTLNLPGESAELFISLPGIEDSLDLAGELPFGRLQ